MCLKLDGCPQTLLRLADLALRRFSEIWSVLLWAWVGPIVSALAVVLVKHDGNAAHAAVVELRTCYLIMLRRYSGAQGRRSRRFPQRKALP